MNTCGKRSRSPLPSVAPPLAPLTASLSSIVRLEKTGSVMYGLESQPVLRRETGPAVVAIHYDKVHEKAYNAGLRWYGAKDRDGRPISIFLRGCQEWSVDDVAPLACVKLDCETGHKFNSPPGCATNFNCTGARRMNSTEAYKHCPSHIYGDAITWDNHPRGLRHMRFHGYQNCFATKECSIVTISVGPQRTCLIGERVFTSAFEWEQHETLHEFERRDQEPHWPQEKPVKIYKSPTVIAIDWHRRPITQLGVNNRWWRTDTADQSWGDCNSDWHLNGSQLRVWFYKRCSLHDLSITDKLTILFGEWRVSNRTNWECSCLPRGEDKPTNIAEWIVSEQPKRVRIDCGIGIFFEWNNKTQQLSRQNGPAMISQKVQIWFVDGKPHRDGGPALIWANGRMEWWVRGKFVRATGPDRSEQLLCMD